MLFVCVCNTYDCAHGELNAYYVGMYKHKQEAIEAYEKYKEDLMEDFMMDYGFADKDEVECSYLFECECFAVEDREVERLGFRH